MIPVPYHQLIEFLEWMKRNRIDLETAVEDQRHLRRLAEKHLDQKHFVVYDTATIILYVIQFECHKKRLKLIEAFDDLDSVLSDVSRRSSYEMEGILRISLHSALVSFQLYVQGKINSGFEVSERNDLIRIFYYLRDHIKEFNSVLKKEFDSWLLTDKLSQAQLDKFDQWINSGGYSQAQYYFQTNTSSEVLAHSLATFLTSDMYERTGYISGKQKRTLLKLHGVKPKEGQQTSDFVNWFSDEYPNVDFFGSLPKTQLKEIVYRFCEEYEYANPASFADDVLGWLKGEGDEAVHRKLETLNIKTSRRRASRAKQVSPVERYSSVPFHGVFLFLSAGDFPAFIKAYWQDLNSLTGDHIDIYYTVDDFDYRVSGFEVAQELSSVEISSTKLPAFLVWREELSKGYIISLHHLTHQEIFRVIQLIVEVIQRAGDVSLTQIASEAETLIGELLRAKLPTVFASTYIERVETMTENNLSNNSGTINYQPNNSGFINNQSWLMDVTQTISQIPSEDAGTKKELQALIEQMFKQLEQVSAEHDAVKQQILQRIDALTAEMKNKQPDKDVLEINGDKLKKAAQNLADVIPTVVGIASSIVAAIFKLSTGA